MVKVGILGLSQRQGTFAEVGLRSWEESNCAVVERLLTGQEDGEYVIHRPLVIRSDRAQLERILRDWCDAPNLDARCDVIFTVGGIGLSPADVVPEATHAAIERVVPGIAELLRLPGLQTRDAETVISRASSGIRKHTLIINLPGSAAAVTAALESLLPLLPALVDAARLP